MKAGKFAEIHKEIQNPQSKQDMEAGKFAEVINNSQFPEHTMKTK